MPTVVTGVRGVGYGVASGRQIVEMADRVFQYDPNKTPLLTLLTGRAQKQLTGNPVFNHLEDEPLPEWDTLGANLSNGAATTITVANGTYFRAGDLVQIPTSLAGGKAEVVLVSSVSSNTLTVVRDWTNNNSGTGGTAALSGDNVIIIGNVNAEYATVRPILSTTEASAVNYTQIIRTPFGASSTLGGTNLYGGSDRTYQRMKFATQHAFECERAALFGQKRETTSGNYKIRSTGGILSWISTNAVNAGGTLTATTMESLAEKVFRYGDGPKLFMVSRRIMSQLDLIAEGRIQTTTGADTYGVGLRRYMSGHGELLIKVHDMLKNSYAGYGIVVDLNNVRLRHMKDEEGRTRDALLRTNIEDPSADGWIDEYLSEMGLHVMLEKSHGYLYGVT